MSSRIAGPALAAFAALLVLVAGAGAERVQRGHLIAAVKGEVAPGRLPRHRATPVRLSIEGHLATDDGSPLPRLNSIRLQIAGHGLLETAGLPVCARGRLRNADSGAALRACRGALVGRGEIEAQAFVAGQRPFPIHSRLLAFNGRTREGRTAIWLHAFSRDPPLAIVLPLVVERRGRRLGTVLRATVPRALGNLPHLARFRISLFRRYRAAGATRSYLSASCPAPPGFAGGYLTVAKATYAFAGGRRLHVGAVRGCRAR